MKSQSCVLIFAVVALFSVSKAQDQTEQSSTRKSPQENGISGTSKTTLSNETTSGIPFTTSSTESPITNKTVKKDPETDERHKDPTNPTKANDSTDTTDSTGDETGVKNNTATASKISTSEYMSVTAGTTTAPSEPTGSKTNSWWGFVILAFIFVLIIALCVILFFLRRVSRTYSFDLHRPGPSRMNEPIGTFEPVYVDDLDHQIDTVQLSPFPATNGTTASPEEKGPNGEAPQVEPLPNGRQTPLPSDPSPTAQTEPDQDQPDQSSSPDLFLDTAREEQQNENNNNPSICSSDPFVEINLEEPQWQLFTSQQTPSSVLPFSPFSFSSSSS